MNDLTVCIHVAHGFPTICEELRRAQTIIDSIKSFEDFEHVFLMGQGLSPNTYRSYLEAVKQFYTFTEGKEGPAAGHPWRCRGFLRPLGEAWDHATAYLRIKGLKKIFAGIRNVLTYLHFAV
ncbi:MAG: hypothetical protein NT005_05995 [Spirochaetes bacterium]|nr:hypothetical protein [Spirochaetota bacterium]